MNDQPGPRARPDEGAELSISAIVNALRAPGGPDELADEDRYLRMFESDGPQATGDDDRPAARPGRGPRTIVIGGRAGVTAAIGVMALGGAAAAYTGALPDVVDSSPHQSTARPQPLAAQPGSPGASRPGSALPTSVPGSTSASTGSTGPAATVAQSPARANAESAGQCTAWSHGGLATTSEAYRRLAEAAGGADQIDAYCAAAAAAAAAAKPHGKPAATGHPPTKAVKPPKKTKPPKATKPPKPAKPAKATKPAKPVKPVKPPKPHPHGASSRPGAA